MVRPLPFFAALVLTSSAFSQTTMINTSPLIIRTQTSDLEDSFTFGPEMCGASYTVRWKYTASFGQVCGDITFWATDAASCGTDPGADDHPLATVSVLSLSTIPTSTIAVKIAELPGFASRTLSDGGLAIKL